MIWRLGRTAIYFFYGLDVEIRPKWTLPGSAPTHPSCLSTRGGAIGRFYRRSKPNQPVRSLQLQPHVLPAEALELSCQQTFPTFIGYKSSWSSQARPKGRFLEIWDLEIWKCGIQKKMKNQNSQNKNPCRPKCRQGLE